MCSRRSGALATVVVAVACLAPAAQAQSPGIDPAGVNDFACKPPPRHPSPVVVVHGTYEDRTITTQRMAGPLTRLGYCVFALDYGRRATGPIERSAEELAAFVERVLEATGAQRVSLVGHSQGGMMPRYWIKFLGGASKVDDLVGLSPSNHGTTNPGAPLAEQLGCVACGQQIAGSGFMRNLNAGEEAPAPVSYTQVQTRNDEVVTPFDSAFLAPTDDGRVTNVLLQDRCPQNSTEHLGIQYDAVALQWMLEALGRPGPADPAFVPDCSGAALETFPDSDSDSGTVPEDRAARGRRGVARRAGRARYRRCRGIKDAGPTGRDPADVQRLRVRKRSCRRARAVARKWLHPFTGRIGDDGRKRFGPWSCADANRGGRQRVRCKARGGRRVRFRLG